MAKHWKKKNNRRNREAMDVSENTVSDSPQAMDTSEFGVPNPNPKPKPKPTFVETNFKVKKSRQMKKTQNVRKMKSIEKAISKDEQLMEKVSSRDSKKSRIQSAKSLYD